MNRSSDGKLFHTVGYRDGKSADDDDDDDDMMKIKLLCLT